jgi:hypothetical protein
LRAHENKTRKFVQVAKYSACKTKKEIWTRSFTLSLWIQGLKCLSTMASYLHNSCTDIRDACSIHMGSLFKARQRHGTVKLCNGKLRGKFHACQEEQTNLRADTLAPQKCIILILLIPYWCSDQSRPSLRCAAPHVPLHSYIRTQSAVRVLRTVLWLVFLHTLLQSGAFECVRPYRLISRHIHSIRSPSL